VQPADQRLQIYDGQPGHKRGLLCHAIAVLGDEGAELVGDLEAAREFAGDGFADEGVVYVPPSCAEQTGCRVHIALHGCQQSREAVGDTFIKESGYAEIADQNRLVILFPQAKAITGINPQGCWDWWGYTGLDYLGKDAPQIATIWAMVEQLAATP